MKITNNKGIALIYSLFTTVILISLSTLFVLRTVHEKNIIGVEKNLAQSFHASNAGTQAGLDGLDNLINNFLLNTISNSTPSGVISTTLSYVSSDDGIGWLLYSVRDNNTPVLLENGAQAEYTQTGTIGNLNYTYNIIITEKEDPIAVTSTSWDFSYNYRVESASTVNNVSKDIVITGDFTVRVQKDNFAKYALFTNAQTLPNGTNVWFTNKTNFNGPLHTNERFNFAFNPSGIFDGAVIQSDQSARFYNRGWPVLLDSNANGTRDVPIFNTGFTRDEAIVTLTSPSQKQDMIDQASANQTYLVDGIYTPNDGTTLTGGIYVEGDSSIALSVNGSNQAVYTVNQGGAIKIITVDDSTQQTTIEDVSAGSTNTYSGMPTGLDNAGTIIFVNGNVTSLQGTVQESTEVTISSNDDITIQNHVLYSDYTSATGSPGDVNYVPPSADGTSNLLGLVSWEGDVLIGTSAPDDVNIHGTIMARDGILQVDSYNNIGAGARGTATLLGGVITDNYGAFGLFNGRTGVHLSGYGRNFIYDQRMSNGSSPPYFPSLSTFIAFTNDITDKMTWQEGDN